MPRKSTDHSQEQRFTLGTYERSQFNDALKAYKTKSYINGIATGIGGVSLGAGALLAGWAYMKFKAPDVQNEIKDFVFGQLDSAADILFPSTPVQFRREAQALAAERARIAKAETVYCSYSSEKYDAAQCSATFQEKDNYFAALTDFQERVTAEFGAYYRHPFSVWAFIFGGLGDINPNEDSNPNNDVGETEEEREARLAQEAEDTKKPNIGGVAGYDYSNEEVI